MMMRRLLMLAGAALLVAVPALAQDAPEPSAQPLTATLYLESGFVPDPLVIPVISAGTIAATELSPDCAGFVAAAPDVIVQYSGGGDRLRFFFYGDGDSVIAVVGPDGAVTCNDDADDVTLQSDVQIDSPADGAYAVFVGAFDTAEQAYGVLGISEFSQADIALRDIDLSRYITRGSQPVIETAVVPVSDLPASPSIYDAIPIGADFTSVTVPAAAGGGQAMAQVSYTSETPEDCAGFATTLPLFTLDVTQSTDLRLYFESDVDTTLIVIDADGNAFCADDSAGGGNRNPVLDMTAAAGTYTLRVGTYLPNSGASGSLTITTDASAEPAQLDPQPVSAN